MATSETGMPRSERLKRITEDVLAKGSMQVDELAQSLNVSRMTIHRDLDDLERRGVLRKVRNGATAQPSSLFESNVAFRLSTGLEEKRRMCRVAASLIEPGQSIILDEATSLLPLVDELAGIGGITVITNFMLVMKRLADVEDVRLIALGGEYLRRFDTFTGLVCETSVRSLAANAYFTSTSSISGGVAYHPDPIIVSIKHAMMQVASKRYLVADRSKFGQTALHKVADLEQFDRIIIDAPLGDREMKSIAHLRDRIIVAPELSTSQKETST
jgi:DeoR/GlpR family transcriptional regulator of sugar metabolism